MKPRIEVKRVLVIRFRRVGDSVLAVSVCKSLKKTFPGVQVDFVLNDNIASLYEGHPDIDRIITFSDKENYNLPKYLKRVYRLMRDTHYDVIIDMRATVKTLFFSLFSLRTPFRIGTKKAYSLFLNNYRVPNRDDSSLDMVQSNLRLLEPLKKITDVKYETSFSLFVPDEEKAVYRSYMDRQGIDFKRPVVLMAVATRIIGKGWNMERMKLVIERMIDMYHPQIIFNYVGEREKRICNRLYEDLGKDSHIFMNVKASSLQELRALTSLCDFFFGNEGGLRHIAQALNVPSFAIYPPGISKTLWLPGHHVRFQGISPDDILPDDGTMTKEERFELLTTERVWEGLNEMLSAYLLSAESSGRVVNKFF